MILLVFGVIRGSISVFGQDSCKVDRILNKSQLTEVEKAINIYWDGKSKADHIKAIKLLEEISTKDPDNWVAHYWVSYISTQVVNLDGKEVEYLKKSMDFIEKAEKAFAKKPDNTAIPYFHALRSLIYGFYSGSFRFLKDTANAELYGNKSMDELNNGIKTSLSNPVLMVLAATRLVKRDEVNYGSNLTAVALLEKAQTEFKKIENRSPADITFWNEHWINFWLNRLAVKKE